MLKAGLTGGLACGKSFVGRALADMGCHLIQADELGHEALLPGGEAYDGVVREFGSGILGEDGAIDRRKLGAEVFGKPERLAILNSLVHPAVFRREEDLISRFMAEDPEGVVVLEAAILIETGSYRRCDCVILAVCDQESQIRRAIKRDQCDREDVLARLSRQMPELEKRKFADYIIDTSGSKEETVRQVRAVFHLLKTGNGTRKRAAAAEDPS